MSDSGQIYSDKKDSIGNILKTRREEMHLTLEQVAQRLRIRLVFLKALEDGRIDLLPGVAYASGFLRAYAELLQLDSDALVKQFRQENQAHTAKPKLMFPAPVPQSGVPAGVMVFFSLIIMIGAYVGWYKMSDHHQSPSEVIPPAPVQTDQNIGKGQQVSPQVASIMPAEHPADAKPNNNQSVASNPTSGNTADASVQTPLTDSLQSLAPSGQIQPNLPVNPPVPSEPENTQAKSVESAKVEEPLMIKAIAPSWLQIKDKAGKVLYQKVLKADETWQVPNDTDEVVMTIGNAGVVVIQQGELQSLPLGKKGRTLRRFTLNAEKAKKLLDPDEAKTDASALSGETSDKSITTPQREKKKKSITSKPASVHDSSADELNARQLNR